MHFSKPHHNKIKYVQYVIFATFDVAFLLKNSQINKPNNNAVIDFKMTKNNTLQYIVLAQKTSSRTTSARGLFSLFFHVCFHLELHVLFHYTGKGTASNKCVTSC